MHASLRLPPPYSHDCETLQRQSCDSDHYKKNCTNIALQSVSPDKNSLFATPHNPHHPHLTHPHPHITLIDQVGGHQHVVHYLNIHHLDLYACGMCMLCMWLVHSNLRCDQDNAICTILSSCHILSTPMHQTCRTPEFLTFFGCNNFIANYYS